MAHHDRARTARRRVTVLLWAGLVITALTSVPLATRPVPPPPDAATVGPDTHPVTVVVRAQSAGAPSGWREAANLLSLPPLPATGAGNDHYRLPVPDAVVRATFAAPAAPWASGHRGVDLEAAVGAQVLAPGSGVVRFAGTVVDRGVVTVEHPDGLRSSIEPVLGQVEVGTRVRAGEVLGTVQGAASHCRDGQCVHWGVRRDRTYLDPLSLLPGSGPVVLLPVRSP